MGGVVKKRNGVCFCVCIKPCTCMCIVFIYTYTYTYIYIVYNCELYSYPSGKKKRSFLMTSDPTPPLAFGLPSDGTIIEMSNFDVLISAVISNIDTNISHSGGGLGLVASIEYEVSHDFVDGILPIKSRVIEESG